MNKCEICRADNKPGQISKTYEGHVCGDCIDYAKHHGQLEALDLKLEKDKELVDGRCDCFKRNRQVSIDKLPPCEGCNDPGSTWYSLEFQKKYAPLKCHRPITTQHFRGKHFCSPQCLIEWLARRFDEALSHLSRLGNLPQLQDFDHPNHATHQEYLIKKEALKFLREWAGEIE